MSLNNIVTQLEELRRFHYTCNDCWYSCPKCDEGCCDPDQGDKCNCGADAHNAKIDAIIAELHSNC